MPELIPKPALGIAFHWADREGNRWVTQDGGIRETRHANDIALAVVELIDGPGPLRKKLRMDLFNEVRALAVEVLLKEQSRRLTDEEWLRHPDVIRARENNANG